MSVRPHQKQKTDPRYRSTWIIDFYDGKGTRHMVQFVGTEIEARNTERSIRISRNKIKPGAFPSLAAAAPFYLEYYSTNHLESGTERTTRSLKILLAEIGSYQFTSVTDELVDSYKRKRLSDGVKPNTINKELACLSGFCKWAHKKGYCDRIKIERFPLKLSRAPFPKVPIRRDVVLFLRAVPRKKRGIFSLMYYLGLRSSEARNIQPENIDYNFGVAIITGKGNKQRIVPINRKAWPTIRNSIPFTNTPKDFRNIIFWARKRAGVTSKITPHLLRHAFGIHMTMKGVPLRALQDLMGHSSSQVTEIYSKLATEHLAKEMNKF